MAAELRFRAMGTDVHLILMEGSVAALEKGRTRLLDLERRWSRFLETSEISRLNAAAGRPVVVSRETAQLVSAAVDGWRRTRGLFDPTVLPHLLAAGYDRSFERLGHLDHQGLGSEAAVRDLGRAPGCEEIMVNPKACLVVLPSGVGLDPGGIAKGLAADWLVKELMEDAAGACVNLGGDVRAEGQPPTEDGWVVSVEDPLAEGCELVRLALSNGAVCTSSKARRRWKHAGRETHHLIDPATGRPARSPVIAVSVVAGTAQKAEVLCKALIVGGRHQAEPLLAAARASAVMVYADGTTEHLRELERFAA